MKPRLLSPQGRPLGSAFSLIVRFPAWRRRYSVLTNRTYDEALDLLNTLQTPYEVLKDRREKGIRIDVEANEEMRRCLGKMGYTQKDLTSLNIVHVAGTKGKGSTCAYTASILMQHNHPTAVPFRSLKVGLFTSPHLISVRERIRINSAPLSKEQFTTYFFDVYNALSDPHPVYFRFLTLMSYHAFIREGVDAAVYETGVGGEYDGTNIVDRPAVTGITTLGIDHTYTLGETLPEIAWHKAGIQKPAVPSFTVLQKPEAMEVIQKRAEERRAEKLRRANFRHLRYVKIRPHAFFQRGNASLAISLAKTVLMKIGVPKPELPDRRKLTKQFKDGLEKVVWRGRCEKIEEVNVTWYLDGAHTEDSVEVAANWFLDEVARKSSNTNNTPKILIFNQQGHRSGLALLSRLHACLTNPQPTPLSPTELEPTEAQPTDPQPTSPLVSSPSEEQGQGTWFSKPKPLRKGDRHVSHEIAFHPKPKPTPQSPSPRPPLVHFTHIIFCPTGTTSTTEYNNKESLTVGSNAQEIEDLTLQRAFAERWRELDDTTALVFTPEKDVTANASDRNTSKINRVLVAKDQLEIPVELESMSDQDSPTTASTNSPPSPLVAPPPQQPRPEPEIHILPNIQVALSLTRTIATSHQFDLTHPPSPPSSPSSTSPSSHAQDLSELDMRVEALAENGARKGGKEGKKEKGDKVQVLITGSVHLVGNALGVLEGVDAL
ncbi:hypothetical protein G7Y89_g12124 [Cudoniella acicularis]|uniref:tetrahydrofolate synthase n=1 Tax=Cudoniella acicularis TaxID=354080 RepID=A0A8H4VZH3_9HELO|nr:hypothetical protein G7Y89_g12124 [Cudoniella acicularis]